MIRVGIIGCGLIGRKRAASLPPGILACVYDTDNAKASALADQYQVPVCASLEALLAQVDAVVVATIHSALTPIAMRAIAAGKHVLIEKPVGINATEIAALQSLAQTHERIVKVGYNHRFHPGLLRAKELVDQGAIGTLLYIRGRYGHGGRIGYDKEWRAEKHLSGGGEIIDQGSHLIDLSQWFLGPLTHAFSHLPTYFWDMKVEDNAFLALRGGNNTIAWLHASWTEWKNLFCFEIFGLTGKIMIDGLGGSYGVEKLTYYQMSPQLGPPATTVEEFPGPDLSWDKDTGNFLAAIVTGVPDHNELTEAFSVIQLIEQSYQFGGNI